MAVYVVVGDLNESWSLESFSLIFPRISMHKNTRQNIN